MRAFLCFNFPNLFPSTGMETSLSFITKSRFSTFQTYSPQRGWKRSSSYEQILYDHLSKPIPLNGDGNVQHNKSYIYFTMFFPNLFPSTGMETVLPLLGCNRLFFPNLFPSTGMETIDIVNLKCLCKFLSKPIPLNGDGNVVVTVC